MTDLKPCPFCKSDDIEADCDPYGNWYVICNGGCRADVERNSVRIAERFSKNDAINVWNTRPREAQLEAEIAELRAKLAAFEGQLTAEEMRERCAQWHMDQARIAMSSTHCGDSESAILTVHKCAEWHEGAANSLRALPTKREEG